MSDSFKDVIYKPCLLCGQLEYDQADGDAIEDSEGNMIYEPRTCDQCNFGNIKDSCIIMH